MPQLGGLKGSSQNIELKLKKKRGFFGKRRKKCSSTEEEERDREDLASEIEGGGLVGTELIIYSSK